MAIQMRRGLQADFDPTKMLPGEWAVSIDTDTSKQVVYMCFSPGVVKKMATITDMLDQIAAATDEIKQQYIATFNEILVQVEAKRQEVSTNTVFVGNFKTLLENTYIPQIEQDLTDSANSAKLSESWTHGGTGIRSGENTDNSKYHSQQSAASAANANTSKDSAAQSAAEAKQYRDEAKQISGLNTVIDDTKESTMTGWSSAKIRSVLNNDLKNQIETIETDFYHGETKYGNALIDIIRGLSYQNTLTGKNLLPFPYADSSNSTFKVNSDGSVTVNGTAPENTALNFLFRPNGGSPFLEAGRYTFSLKNGNLDCHMVIGGAGSTVPFTYIFDKEVTIDIPNATIGYCLLQITNGKTVHNLTVYPMIRQSTITDDTYEPYCGGIPSPNADYKQEIQNLGIFNPMTGLYEWKIFSSGKNLFGKNANELYPVKLKEGTSVTFSRADATNQSEITLYDKNGVRNDWWTIMSGAYSRTVTIAKDAYFTSYLATFGTNAQLELGYKATPYDSYKGWNQITILSDEPWCENDKIYRIGGKYYKYKGRAKSVLNGTEPFFLETTSSNTIQFAMGNFIKDASNDSKGATLLSTHFKQIRDIYNVDSEGIGYTNGANFLRIRVNKTRLSTPDVTGLKAYLAQLYANGTPIIIEYDLAEPIIEELDTNTQHDLLSLPSNDGVTNLWTDSELNPSLVVEVPKTNAGGYALKSFCDANRPDYELPVTLKTGTWTGTTAPYSYVITDSKIDGRDVEVLPTTMTDAQAIALNKAMISNPTMDVANNKITLKSYGAKPTIDIPIVLAFKGVV